MLTTTETLLKRLLLLRMTTARPDLRLQSVRQVRRHISLIRLLPWLLHPLAVLFVATLASVIWHLAQPTWIELPDSAGEFLAKPQRLVITLDGGHYIQPEMRMRPLVGPVSGNDNSMRRYPIYIKGKGTLKCPDLTFCEVHLGSGVKFITSGHCKPDGYSIKEPIPPSDADWDNRIGHPAYVVERGAKLVFTDNDSYPDTLVRRQ